MRFSNFRFQFVRSLFFGMVLFFGGLSSLAFSAEVVDRVVALVNGEMISLSELNERMEPFADKIKSSGYPLAEQRPLLFKLREEKLREIINEKLADQEVERLGIEEREAEVDEAIERFKVANRLNDKSLKESLLVQGMTYEALRDRIKQQLLRVALVNREVRTKIVVTDEDIEQYYRTHPAEFGAEVQYHLKNILKRVPPAATAEQKSRLYEELEEVRQSVTTVADFEAAAKEHSDAPNSNDGGEIGTIPLDALSGPIRDAILELEPEEVSAVIKTEQGYQIFQLVDSAQTSGEPLEKVQEQISEKLYQQQVDRAYGVWLDNLYDNAYIKRLP